MAITHTIRSTIRNTRRYAEVLEILIRFGFGSVITETGLDRMIHRGKQLLGSKSADEDLHRLPEKVRIRLVLEELGPTFIKLGQVLSTRPDLIPPEYAEEFRKLQSDCPQVAYEEIEKRLRDEFGEDFEKLFASVEETAIAAASIAQCHRAVLRGVGPVVLKILRPEIEDVIDRDVEVLTDLARFVERHFGEMGYSPTEVVREFEKQIYRELDMIQEARATDRLRSFFEDTDQISFAKVYWKATTKRVMAMEEIHGILLSQAKPGDLSDSDRRRAVENGADAVFRMCLEFGFFHADPHPGNIFVLPGGRVYFIDCGMTGHIDERTAQTLAEFLTSVVAKDLDRVVRASLALTDGNPGLESDRGLRADTWELMTRVHTESLDQLDVPALLEGLFDILRRYHVRCPADLVYLIKALSTVEGVALQFDPKFDLISHIRPHVELLVSQQYGLSAARRRLQKSMLSYVELAEDLPEEIRMFLSQVHRRDFSIRLDHVGLEGLRKTVDRSSKYVSGSMIIAAMVIGSSILVHTTSGQAGWGFFVKLGAIGLVAGGALSAGLMLMLMIRKS